MGYRFLDHTADIAVEVTADSLEKLFETAAYAWREAVIEITGEGEKEKRIYLAESTLELLLVNFLDELNYLLNTRRWVFDSIASIKITGAPGDWNLNSLTRGTDLENAEYLLKEEIKAVTFHQMYIQEIDNQYTTRIVFDI